MTTEYESEFTEIIEVDGRLFEDLLHQLACVEVRPDCSLSAPPTGISVIRARRSAPGALASLADRDSPQ